MNLGLYFGTFNPIHNGHLNIAKYILTHTKVDELIFVLTPQNPIKSTCFVEPELRIDMLRLAIKDIEKVSISDIEMSIPPPNYTYKTINKFRNIYHEANIFLIIGEDNLETFERWKNYKQILSRCKLYVYPRSRQGKGDYIKHKNIIRLKSCLYDISSTKTREMIAKGNIPRTLIPNEVIEFIKMNNLYSI